MNHGATGPPSRFTRAPAAFLALAGPIIGRTACEALVPPVVFFAARDYTFDVIFVFMFGYALFAWAPLSAEERARFRARYREWLVEVRR